MRERGPIFGTVDQMIGAAAIYESLFNKKTIGQRDENTSSILIDTLADTHMFSELDLDQAKKSTYLNKKLQKVSELTPQQES